MASRLTEEPADQPTIQRKAAVLVFALVLVALLINALFADGGVLQLMHHRQRTATLHRELETLRQDNALLAREIALLRSDPRTVERLAREELGLAGPGETVFLIRSDDASTGF
jgi:cell division protein FtsB